MLFKRQDIKELNDQSLLTLFREKGDMACMDEVYRRYGHLVYGVCLKYLKSPEEARDALFGVFEKLFVELKRQEVQHLPAWLHTVTKNQCLMFLRKKDYLVVVNDGSHLRLVEDDDDEQVEQKLNLENRLDELEKALRMLKGPQQECIRMFYIEEKSYKEISDATGYSLNEVKSFIQNGKRNLKLLLQRTA